MKPYYVVLTGSKNNAGDFLIKARAKALLAEFRPDREVVDLNAWDALNGETLRTVNGARALILLGGPSLRENMYPGIYKLTGDLDDIRVPITSMGVGWKSLSGEWRDTHGYLFSRDSLVLLRRIERDGIPFSVRDYQSVSVLQSNGFSHISMTGCPAYYHLPSIGSEPRVPEKIRKVAFSLGVSFVQSTRMRALMCRQILRIRERFKGAEFQVVFHHSLDPVVYQDVYKGRSSHIEEHLAFARWLGTQGISYVDISGSAEALVNYYSEVDLHIGYRVHAHVFMNSLSKLSLLIAEDGRAKGSARAIGGMVVDGYRAYGVGLLAKLFARLGAHPDPYQANDESVADVLGVLEYELNSGAQKSKCARKAIDVNFEIMKDYLERLP